MTAMDAALAAVDLAGAEPVAVTGVPSPAALASPLAVAECAVASVAACLSAAAELAHARTGRRPHVELDTAHVAAAVRGEAWLRDPDGNGIEGFAPLSRLWPAADGWVRTHANYPWHRAALLAALDVDDDGASLARAISSRSAREVERTVYGAGGLAVAARTRAEWLDEVGGPDPSPLVRLSTLDGRARDLSQVAALPASGVRVLDLTRVIAGPVGTRMLGALGADVLRVDNPARPELLVHAIDGIVGKRSTIVDGEVGNGILHDLLDAADVLVTGYRPGALRRLGLDPDQVADRHPGVTVVTLSAWGDTEGWQGRRGFDSLVQVASGIGWAVGDDRRPGVLPCQLLDHATGYLVAAGALAALTRRVRTGTASQVSLSLARTAQWLLDQRPPWKHRSEETDAERFRTDFGNGWTGIGPPGRLDGRPLRWPHLPPEYGHAAPRWTER
jgi:crotonobetainyl-CoA:carnitine CoA-transferase CaiB-like acyl-CoA transferase